MTDVFVNRTQAGYETVLFGVYYAKTSERAVFMCTCITYKNGDFYFGRNMDLEYSFGEAVVITPRHFSLHFRHTAYLPSHYAMVGMAAAGGKAVGKMYGRNGGFPLYAEAVNEKGLCMAGLNFPGNAYYEKASAGRLNIATFELIPWILGGCASVSEAEEKLTDMNISNDAFSPSMPPAQLHWMLADADRCLVIESVREGIRIYENPIGVLTNNPSFEYHRANLNNYLNVTSGYSENRFCRNDPAFPKLQPYSQGMGGIGLPGDFSSASRFVKAAFLKWNSACGQDEVSNVSQFFHILDGAAMTRGAVITQDGKYDMTTYSCCVNVNTGVYYYKTYENNQINAVDMKRADIDKGVLIVYELEKGQNIKRQN